MSHYSFGLSIAFVLAKLVRLCCYMSSCDSASAQDCQNGLSPSADASARLAPKILQCAVAEATSRPSYHPSVLLTLYIYGYLNRVQSTRRLEREADRNVVTLINSGGEHESERSRSDARSR